MPGRVPSEPGWAGEHQLSGSHFELCLDPKTCLHCGLDTFQIQLCPSSYYFWARTLKLCGSLVMLPTNFSIPNSQDACVHELESLGLSRVTTTSSRLSPSSARTDALSLRHSQAKLPAVFMEVCQAVGQPELPNHQARTFSLRWMRGIGPEVTGLGNQAGPANNNDAHKNDTLRLQEDVFLQKHHTSVKCQKTWHFWWTESLILWPGLVLRCCFPQRTGSLKPPSLCTSPKTSLWQSTSTNLLLCRLNMLFTPLDRAWPFRLELMFLRNKHLQLMYEDMNATAHS